MKFHISLFLLFPIKFPLAIIFNSLRQNHLFFNQLRRRTVDWQPFIKSVSSLTKERITEICEAVPPVFGNHTNRICEHLLSAAEKHQELEFELQRSFL